MSDKLWGGRFSEDTDVLVEAFNASIDVDKRLAASDIAGSKAHLAMMARQGIIPAHEGDTLRAGLDRVAERIALGDLPFSHRLEDIHMHVEDALGQECGDLARKLHTGRSRNDQVALDIRIYLKEQTRHIMDCIDGLQGVLARLAHTHVDVIMPGYTHMQRAQPVLFAHHLMAYYEMMARDKDRFAGAFRRMDAMPLGTAALAGTTFPVDRDFVRQELGFARLCANSMDAVSDRDFVMEFISHGAICMIHLSRLSEELILWSSSEFGFITISDAFTTGSSIMPQKKNPDVAELVRGKTGRVVGNLMAILTLMKSLPLAYNKDMQEDKEPLFDTIDTLDVCLRVYTRMLPHITVHRDRMRAACESGFLNATDFADYLVTRGIAFRQAHAVAGKAVAFALEAGRELLDLSLEEMRGFSDLIQQDIYDYLQVDAMIRRRISAGGTSFESVRAAVAKALEAHPS